MKQKLLFGTFLLFSYCLSSQVTVEETSLGIGEYWVNYQSVFNKGENVYVGGICSAIESDPLELNFYRSKDKGGSWITVQYADIETTNALSEYLYVKNITFFNENVGLASCSATLAYYARPADSQFIIKTADGGESWDIKFSQPSSNPFESISDIDFFDDQNGIALGYFDDGGTLNYNVWGVVTSDQGETWTPIEFPQELLEHKTIQNFSIIDETTAYLVAQHSYNYDSVLEFFVYKTTDKGVTWEKTSDHRYPAAIDLADAIISDIEFVNDKIGFISFYEAYEKSVLIKTVDGGLTWNMIDHPLDVAHGYEDLDFTDVYFVNEQEGYILAGNYCNNDGCFRGYGILYSNDGGNTWIVLDANKNSGCSLVDMSFDETTGVGFAAGGGIEGNGGAVFKINGNASVGTVDIFDEIKVDVFPNPSSDVVSFTNDLLDDYHVNILTADGKLVKTFILHSGTTTINLDNGQYVYKIESNEHKSSKNGLIVIEK